MQSAQPERDFNWSDEGVRSSYQFLQRLYGVVESFAEAPPEGERGVVADYVNRETDRLLVIAEEDFETLSFTTALRELREIVSLLQRYTGYTEPHAETMERALEAVVYVLAPVSPHVTEELWSMLGNDGFVAEAEWPTFDGDLEGVELERQLIDEVRDDVRQIADVADIEDPEHIELAVAPEWKFEAHEIARTSESDNVIQEIMQREELRSRGEAVSSYGQDLQEERQSLTRQLFPRPRAGGAGAGQLADRRGVRRRGHYSQWRVRFGCPCRQSSSWPTSYSDRVAGTLMGSGIPGPALISTLPELDQVR
jgi:leucyl-tRNA synthetase